MNHQICKIDRETNIAKETLIVSGTYREAEETVSKKNDKLKTDRYYWTVTIINI